jgi:hypothetical protein
MIVVRYADDAVVGFEHRSDAERLLAKRIRMAEFAVVLHPDKTRMIEVGRRAAMAPAARGQECWKGKGFRRRASVVVPT